MVLQWIMRKRRGLTQGVYAGYREWGFCGGRARLVGMVP